MVHSDAMWPKYMLEVRGEHGKQSEEENQKRKVVCAKNVKFSGKCQMEGT